MEKKSFDESVPFQSTSLPQSANVRPSKDLKAPTDPPVQTGAHFSSSPSILYTIDSSDFPRIQQVCYKIDENFKKSVFSVKHPDFKTPFRNMDDVLSRLVPYHLLGFVRPVDGESSLPKLKTVGSAGMDAIAHVSSLLQRLEASYTSNYDWAPVERDDVIDVIFNRLLLETEKRTLLQLKADYDALKQSIDPDKLCNFPGPPLPADNAEQPSNVVHAGRNLSFAPPAGQLPIQQYSAAHHPPFYPQPFFSPTLARQSTGPSPQRYMQLHPQGHYPPTSIPNSQSQASQHMLKYSNPQVSYYPRGLPNRTHFQPQFFRPPENPMNSPKPDAPPNT